MSNEKRRDAAFLSRLGVCVIVQLWSVLNLQAQDTTRSTPSWNCYHGRAPQTCGVFPLSEFGYYYRAVRPSFLTTKHTFDGKPDRSVLARRKPAHASWEAGAMRNRGASTAIGGTLVIGVTEEARFSVGVKGRYRHWLTRRGLALDVGAGAEQRGDEHDLVKRRTFEFTGDVAINVRDYAAVVARFDVVRVQGRGRPALSLGLRTGTKPPFVATTTALIVAYMVKLGIHMALSSAST